MTAQHSQYLESKVLTAAPHRLHLMLIEGAIRFGRQAEGLLHRGETAAAAAPLLRVVDIVGEMLAAVRGRNTDINKKLVDLYWYLFRRASEAKLNSDGNKLAEALRLLEFERQTWLAVCERFAAPSAATSFAPKIRRRPRRAFLLKHSCKSPYGTSISAHTVVAINIMLHPTMLMAAWKTAVCRNALKWLSRAK